VFTGALASVSGAPSWMSKPYNTWTDAELKEVLNDSGWASKGSITYSTARGGNSQPIEDTALISWVSAKPLREASVRQQLGATPTPSKEAEAVLAATMNFYLVSVKVSGGGSSGSYGSAAARMQAETFLMRDGKPPIAAVQSEGRALDKEGKIIEPPAPRGGGPGAPPAAPGAAPVAPAPGRSQQMQVLPSSAAAAFQRGGGGGGFPGGGFPGGGAGGFGGGQRGVASVMIYVFPKTDPITIDDKEVEFVSKLCGAGFGGRGAAGGGAPAGNCTLNVKKKFKLKDMLYNGELAL
jgi:hypothetical protein